MKNKKKIYFLINSLEGGGAERVIVNISSKLGEKYDVDLVTLKRDNFYDLPKGVNHIPLSNIKNNFLMFLATPFFVYKMRKYLKNTKPASGLSSLEIANFIHILSNKNAIISFETNIIFFSGFIGIVYKLFIKILYKKAKIIKVNSIENAFSIASYLDVPIAKVKTIYNPIDFEKINILANEEIEDELKNKIQDKIVFITVGRLIHQKNHKTILQSFKKIKEKNFVYLIIGEGKEKNNLVDLVQTFGLQNNVIFLGAQKNVFQYLRKANFFIYASKIEGFPNVLGEAIAGGIPIITSNFVSGARECIMGEYTANQDITYPFFSFNGVLLDINHYEDNFIKIYKKLDKIKQNQKGIEKFDINNIVLEYERLLFNI